MPLHRYNDACRPVFGGVVFQMTDGKIRIVYRVTSEALQDRASIDGDDSEGHTLDVVDMFLKHRARIEQIASNNHDAGDVERVVTTVDLNPFSRAWPHRHGRLRSSG
jgi:hypothetical protein